MGFRSELDRWPPDKVRDLVMRSTPADVARALAATRRSVADLAALMSPAAEPRLEEMAQAARRLTRRYFGRTMGLYVPLYISNVCLADCLYCGYAVRSGSRMKRRTLSTEEIRRECEALAARGFQNVLILSGEARRAVPVERIATAVRVARELFPSVSIETYALGAEGYRRLADEGIEGVTLYMETYDTTTYSRVHVGGEKTDFDFRLDAIERAGEAGVRRLSIGALLGLHDWRLDGFWMGLHARYLHRVCWGSSVCLSFPRLRGTPERFTIEHAVSDRELVQLILAMRLFLPDAGFNLSTREGAGLRDRLIPLGITMMSAGSSTRPGGYSTPAPETLEQFGVEDTRSPAEVAEAIRRAGYDPVWKDFDRAFHEAH
jgi:2-iminoacetate synthase